jgi:hypothetical protein
LEPKGGYMCLFWNWVSPMVSLRKEEFKQLYLTASG